MARDNTKTWGSSYDSYDALNAAIDADIEEIISWFSSNAHTISGDECRKRYVYSTKTLNYIMSQVKHPEYLSVKKMLDKCGDLFCYVLDYRADMISEAREKYAKKNNQYLMKAAMKTQS